jgi:hypothetical protein
MIQTVNKNSSTKWCKNIKNLRGKNVTTDLRINVQIK